VEYKRGRPKPSNWDKIQLCAQALCLEEMHGIPISEGALWYGQTRHREPVAFDAALRAETVKAVEDVRAMLDSGVTPAPEYGKHCKACSLYDTCQPKLLEKDRSLSYVARLFEEEPDA
jgi:CRISPR-associated exonuclease Cas4